MPSLDDDLFSQWHMGWDKNSRVYCGGDDGWRWAEGKERGFKDPTCGSDLTLHDIHANQVGLGSRGSPMTSGHTR